MERFVKELEYCTYCPKLCRHACPVGNATGSESLTPQSKMQLLNMLRRRAVPWDQDYILPLFGCTSCRLCQSYCLHGIDVATILQEGRAAAEHLRLTHPALDRLPEAFRQRNQTLSEKLHREFSSHLFAADAQVGYMPGCEVIDYFIDDVRDMFRILDTLNLNFVRLVEGPQVCAGYPLWAAGQLDAARFVAQDMIRTLKRFKTVIVGCPTCAWLLRDKLPSMGFEHSTEILHISEYLYVHTERLDIRRTRPAAYYHDPCYLGRTLKVFDPPRRLLSRCVDGLREFFYNREEAECCGGGGLLPQTFPEAAEAQARRRLSEVTLFEVPLLVTSCPTCKRTFQSADPSVEVMDLVNLLAWCLHDPDRPALPL